MNSPENNFGDLLKDLRDDTTTLVREEIALAKTELCEKAASLSRNTALLIGGALLGYTALIPLLFAFGFWLQDLFVSRGVSEGTSAFLGLLIVSLITAGISAALVLNALSAFRKQKLTPQKTIQSLKEDKQLIQSKLP